MRIESYCGLDALWMMDNSGEWHSHSRTNEETAHVPMVEEVEETLELARGDVGEDKRSAVGLARTVHELALEEVLEVRRVALQEVPVDPE